MEAHQGYAKHDAAGHGSGNSHNGSTCKMLKEGHGEVEVATPRKCNGTLEMRLIGKRTTRPFVSNLQAPLALPRGPHLHRQLPATSVRQDRGLIAARQPVTT